MILPCKYSKTCVLRLINDTPCIMMACSKYASMTKKQAQSEFPSSKNTIEINLDVKTECAMCHKEFNPLETTHFMLKGHIYSVCWECAGKLEEMLKGENE